ncbi:MAG TPA: hypothetical protein VFB54_02665 [Burkholderiales bacterium]|nr:hypothetical protein [Burkholderiales bacterium]
MASKATPNALAAVRKFSSSVASGKLRLCAGGCFAPSRVKEDDVAVEVSKLAGWNVMQNA